MSIVSVYLIFININLLKLSTHQRIVSITLAVLAAVFSVLLINIFWQKKNGAEDRECL